MPQTKLNDFGKGYIAGLLDGEGSIVLGKHPEKRSRLGFSIYCSVRIHNTNLNLLNRINEMYLGKIYKSSNKKVSCYRWQISTAGEIKNLLEQILPFLVVKKDRAEKAIEFCSSRLGRITHKSGYTKDEVILVESWDKVPTNCGNR